MVMCYNWLVLFLLLPSKHHIIQATVDQRQRQSLLTPNGRSPPILLRPTACAYVVYQV